MGGLSCVLRSVSDHQVSMLDPCCLCAFLFVISIIFGLNVCGGMFVLHVNRRDTSEYTPHNWGGMVNLGAPHFFVIGSLNDEKLLNCVYHGQ